MIKLAEIKVIAEEQKERLLHSDTGLYREVHQSLPFGESRHALIISGIRRSGKSTLLGQMIQKLPGNSFFLNFDTPKLYNLDITDFELIDLIIKEHKVENLFFDEIQIIDGWEVYVRQKLDEGYNVAVTGSNASLLSRELGTRLTGRHITKELFPFSYTEFCALKELPLDEGSFSKYAVTGGFPEYVVYQNQEILQALFEDILFRDIAVRHGIRDISSLKRLLIYLVANTGNLVTATKLTKVLNIKSSATILDYFSYFEQSYLLSLMPKFSHSYRAQLVNPRKIYVIDNGLIDAVNPSVGRDMGRKLENLVYWYLRRERFELHYFNESRGECDFVVSRQNRIEKLIQVCFDLNHDNTRREENGLCEAMDYFNIDEGWIVTKNQKDEIRHNKRQIHVVPAHEFFSTFFDQVELAKSR